MPTFRTPWRGAAAAFALNGFLLGAWASRVPAVAERHGLSEAELGFMILLMGLGALVSFPLAGRLSDALGAVRLTRRMAPVYLLSLVLAGLAPSPLTLGAALVLFGAAHGAMDVAMNGWAAEVERQMGRSVMSSIHAMWSFGAGIGAASGLAAVGLGLTVGLHFALAALAVGAAMGPFLSVPWTSRIAPRQGRAPVFALPRGPLILVGLIALSSGFGEGAMVDWSAILLREGIGATEARAALGYTVYSGSMVAMRLCADRLVVRLGPGPVARAGGLTAALGVALVTGPMSFPLALAGFALMGLGLAVLVPLAFSRAAADPEIPPGQAIASVATMGYGSVLMGPALIGLIAEATSLRLAFMLLGLCALLAAALAPVLGGKGTRPVAATGQDITSFSRK
ncbi:MFS transporter [Rhodovulum sp. BSW8]|uniref:MFS transporter n=1 Tax=Rhodovulum sp. BSW8 TaxID=2259645 RepID=UPI000DE35E67|nr:MFS transporter [Rhodovulum sp. BSW8]RBO51272.1 MFS transporter [Rhodovulum sp. BSW8]